MKRVSESPAAHVRSRGAPLVAVLCAAGALLAAARPLAAQRNPCTARHPMVDALRFTGNDVLAADALAAIIATERTGIWRRWFGWKTGPLTCLDSAALVLDAIRVRELYAERGYPGTNVAASVTRRGERRAQVTFAIREAAPIVISAVTVVGLPRDAASASALERQLHDAPLDSLLLATVTDSVQRLIQNAGYARALPPPRTVSVVDSALRHAAVTLTFRPGAPVYIGKVSVAITPIGTKSTLSQHDILSVLRFKPGDRFNARLVGASQRDLYELELYRAIRIDTLHSASDTVPVAVTLVEGDVRRLRVAGGWGTLDCFRAQTRFVSQNYLHSGHRYELNARLSKIGLSDPFSGLSSLCAPRLRDDPFSQHLDYYAGATINLRGVPGANLKPTLTIYSERRSEFAAYQQSTDIGVVASVTRELAPRLVATAQYQFVDGKTAADGAVSCDRFGFCRVEDLRSFLRSSPIHSVGVALVKNPLQPTDDPVTGHRWQLEVRQGFTKIARADALTFTHLMGEAAAYRPLGTHFVVAVRAQLGYVVAPASQSYLLPPQERFYSGGQNSVRGYDQNYLGPGSYIVGAYHDTTLADGTPVGVVRPEDGYRRIAPSGANAIWLANAELRTRNGWPAGLLRWVFFVDAGRVWNTNDVFSVTNASPRVTPGIGVRLVTPLGPFRVDVGYNPYALDAGPAFFLRDADPAAGRPGRAICVSPGTVEPLTLAPGLAQPALLCPATFLPVKRRGVLPRLAIHFSIGNAF
jgi:outer membrane protein insertion porin family/translocation and assembly module TamA